MRFDRILVGIDLASDSLVALARARALPGPGGSIHLLHAIDVAAASRVGGSLAADVVSAESPKRAGELEGLARELRQWGVAVSVEVRGGRPADEVVAAAERAGADVIVVGSRARGDVARSVIGSVAEEVCYRSPIPVLVVRENLGGASVVGRVVVAADGSEPGHAAARAAGSLARRLGVRLEAIHVLERSRALEQLAAEGAGFPLDDVPAHVARKLGCSVAEELHRTVGRTVPIRFAAGEPDVEIARFVRPEDILVSGTHGRGAVGRLPFGSVARKLLRKAACPLLVVRSAVPGP